MPRPETTDARTFATRRRRLAFPLAPRRVISYNPANQQDGRS
jgi:hypothetical protein